MKQIFIILGLLTLVSCGSGRQKTPIKDWFENCAQDQIAGHECKTPPAEEADFVMTDIETITYGTDPVYIFDKLTALGLLKFKTGTISFGGEGEGWREILVNENGEMIFNIWLGTEADKTLYWSSPIDWSFEEDILLIDGATITYTTFK